VVSGRSAGDARYRFRLVAALPSGSHGVCLLARSSRGRLEA
jgi:hypothetical protein